MNDRRHQDVENRMPTGIPGLDEIMGGGLPRNYVYLIQGDPGSGKTTMSMQFLLDGARRGERTMFITLSESVEELREVGHSHGWDLDGIELFEPPLAKTPYLPEDQNTLFHPSEIELAETMKMLLDKIEEVKPHRLVLDSLSEIRLLAQTPLRYRRQVLAFKQYFAGRETTVFLLDDRTYTDDIQMQSVPSGVIELFQTSPVYGAERRKLRVVKVRGVSYSGGYHDFNIIRGGVEVYPRLLAAESRPEPRRLDTVSSGVMQIDRLLGGGLTEGTSTLITGPSGTGKSSLSSQYAAAAAARGENVAMFIFDESRTVYLERSASLGLKLEDHLEEGHLLLQQVDPAELLPGEFVHLVRQTVEKHDVRLVVIDSLNGFLNSMPETKFLSTQLHEVLTWLGQKGVTTILISTQHGLLDMAGISDADISYLADAVILLRYFEIRGSVRKAISVIKKRTGPHETTIRELEMTSRGIAVGPPLVAFHDVLGSAPVYESDTTPEVGDELADE
jgi:circadian clock protein KaiC